MGIDHLLKALWYSEFLCRFSLYRTAIIILADIGLEFGMTQKSRQIIEEIMPQVSVKLLFFLTECCLIIMSKR